MVVGKKTSAVFTLIKTIQILQGARNFKAYHCFMVHNVPFSLPLSISG